MGGGDLSRGGTGHRGASFEDSVMKEDFCGMGARTMVSGVEGGGSVGVVAAVNCCLAVADCVGVL